VVRRARELLHEGDADGGCEKACYECLCSFYNQHDHDRLDRRLVLPFLQSLRDLAIEPVQTEAGPALEELAARCDSDLERQVLQAIHARGLPLPGEAQKVLYDGDEPVAIVDFVYAPRIVVFVDGSPHHLDYVQAADDWKRKRLKARGYRIVVIRGEEMEQGLEDLAAVLGTGLR